MLYLVSTSKSDELWYLVAHKNLIRKKKDWGQGQYICGPDMEGHGQVHKNSPGPGPDRTSDSLDKNVVQRLKILAGAIQVAALLSKKRKRMLSLIFPVWVGVIFILPQIQK